jgi:acyl-CoA synthetase (AMP-forming)/AMP-acid ligase II
MEVRIVDPATSRACRPNVVGEVWVRSPSVAQGYWRRPAETEATFGARLEPSNTGPFLRTGDLGFMDETGELFVTGRVKDVLILRGRNVYPQDIEACAEGCHPDLRRGCVAAFSVNEDGVDRAVVVQELRSGSTTDPSEIVRTIRKTVSETVGVRLHAVVLIAAQTIPKTSSGKIQRSACRAAFLSGRLKEAARWNEAPRVLATHAAI